MLKGLYKEEKGTAVVIFALFIVLIIGMAGLVIDIGAVYNARSQLKKTANAAALSGAQELTNNEASVNEVVENILAADDEEKSLKELGIQREGEYKLRVSLEREIPMNFLRLFKINSIKANASSTAGLLPMNRANGAVPLGIDKSVSLEYMKEYKLKVDSGDSLFGNFGILALSGPGAKLYEQDLKYGFDGELQIGDIIDTQTGNIEGKTKNAIDYRISSSPYPEGDITSRNNPRIMLVLIYEPYKIESNQMKQVKIDGFAYFYIKQPMDKNDSSITGYFIKRAGNGFGAVDAENKGAYAIRLME